MKVVMIKEGPIDGVMKQPGDEIDVNNTLGSRLVEFKFAVHPDQYRAPKEKQKTPEEKKKKAKIPEKKSRKKTPEDKKETPESPEDGSELSEE